MCIDEVEVSNFNAQFTCELCSLRDGGDYPLDHIGPVLIGQREVVSVTCRGEVESLEQLVINYEVSLLGGFESVKFVAVEKRALS